MIKQLIKLTLWIGIGVLLCNESFADDFTGVLSGYIGRDLVDSDGLQFSFGQTVLSFSKRRTSCDMASSAIEAKVDAVKSNGVNLTFSLPPHATLVDVFLERLSVDVDGIPYIQYKGQTTLTGRIFSIVLRQIKKNYEDHFPNKFYGCQNQSFVDFFPGTIQALVKPALHDRFEKYVRLAGFAWHPVKDDDLPIPNLVQITGLTEGSEDKIAAELLRQKFILDTQRVPRPRRDEGNNWWTGSLGNVLVSTWEEKLSALKCRNDLLVAEIAHFYLHLEDMNNYIVVIGDKNGRSVETRAKRHIIVDRGIPIEKIESPEVDLNGRKQVLRLERPLAGYSLRLEDHCLYDGASSGLLKIILFPDFYDEAKRYFSRKRFEWKDEGETNNNYVLTVPDGAELGEMEELRKQPFTADVERYGAELGGPPTSFRFPARSIYVSVSTDQETLRDRLLKALKKPFLNCQLRTLRFPLKMGDCVTLSRSKRRWNRWET